MTKINQKSALVLGGGGSRGSYSVGVIATLTEQKKSFDIVTGISIGSFVGAIYAMQADVNLPQWIASITPERVATEFFGFPNRKNMPEAAIQTFNNFIAEYEKGGPSVSPLHDSFAEIFDFDKFKSSKVDYACLAANLTQNKEAVFYKKDMQNEEDAINAMLASSAYFPAFSFKKVGNDYYADGGFLNATLGKTALGMGATDLTVVALSDPELPVNYEQGQTSLMIQPIVKLSYFLDFDSQTLKNQIMQGRLDALKFMNLAPGYIYTFYAEDHLIFETLSKITAEVLRKNNMELTNNTLLEGITALLGYKPAPLHNDYMKSFQAGLILECLGLIANLSYYQRYHLIPFIKEILAELKTGNVNFQQMDTQSDLKMNQIGAKALMRFFHTALTVYGGKLPPEFDQIITKFKPVYGLSIAWYILDKFSLVLHLL